MTKRDDGPLGVLITGTIAVLFVAIVCASVYLYIDHARTVSAMMEATP